MIAAGSPACVVNPWNKQTGGAPIFSDNPGARIFELSGADLSRALKMKEAGISNRLIGHHFGLPTRVVRYHLGTDM